MPHRLDITTRLHERLLEIVRSALPLITSSMADADLAGLLYLRGEMIEAMQAYCRHVHHLRDAALQEQDPQAIERAIALVGGCVSLQAAYGGFRTRWVHRNAVENWHEYRLSAIVMMKQVRNDVQRAQALMAAEMPLAA